MSAPRLARLLVLLPEEMLADIDQHRRAAPDLPPRAEAIRRLIRAGLEATKPPAKQQAEWRP